MSFLEAITIPTKTVIAMRELFFKPCNQPDLEYPSDISKKIDGWISEGRVQMRAHRNFDNYVDGYPGIVFVMKKLRWSF